MKDKMSLAMSRKLCCIPCLAVLLLLVFMPAAAAEPEPGRRIEYYRRQANLLVELGRDSEACEHWKRFIATSADDVVAAQVALREIIEIARRPHDRSYVSGVQSQPSLRLPLYWFHYSCRRLSALDSAGLLKDDEALEVSFRALHESFVREGAFGEVWNLLHNYAERFGETDWWVQSTASAIARAGHAHRANDFLQSIAPARQYEEHDSPSYSHIYPVSPSALEGRWRSISIEHSTPEEFAAAMHHDASGEGLMEVEPNLYRSYLLHVTDQLPLIDTRLFLFTQRIQERRVASEAAEAAAGGDWRRVVSIYRGAPWAPSVHRALVASGEAHLLQGLSGPAIRAFKDVLAFSNDDPVRAQAAAGLMLAIASSRSTKRFDNELEAVLAMLPNDMVLTVGGRRISPREFAGQLSAVGSKAYEQDEAAASVAGIRRQMLQLPALPLFDWNAWHNPMRLEDGRLNLPPMAAVPSITLHPRGDKVFAAWQFGLASFDASVSDPDARLIWFRSIPVSSRQGWNWNMNIPGEFRPSIAGERIYTRWNLNRTRAQYSSIACVDAATGSLIWSTESDAALAEFAPVNDPVAVEGSVYFIAARTVGRGVNLLLVSLDANDGSVVWTRPICHSAEYSSVQGTWGYWNPAAYEPHTAGIYSNLAWGSPVTVDDGALYFQTNTGLVGKCDARDGAIIWLQTYSRPVIKCSVEHLVRRVGNSPSISDGIVLFTPRDYTGAFALDAATGAGAWDIPLLPSDRILGTHKGMTLLSDSNRIAAIDTASGEAVWTRRLSLSPLNPPVVHLAGSTVYAELAEDEFGARLPERRLVRISAADGTTLDVTRLDSPLQAITVSQSKLSTVAKGLDGAADSSRKYPVSEPGASGPLAKLWHLTRPGAQLLLPEDAPYLERLLLHYDGIIESIPLTPEGVEWSALVPPGFHGPFVWQDAIVFLYPRSLLKLDANTGRIDLEMTLPFNPRSATLDDEEEYDIHSPLMALVEGRYLAFAGWHELAVFDLETNELRNVRLPSHSPQFHIFGIKWVEGRIAVWFGSRRDLGSRSRRLIIDPETMQTIHIGQQNAWTGYHASVRISRYLHRRNRILRERAFEHPLCRASGNALFKHAYDEFSRKLTRTNPATGETVQFVLPPLLAERTLRIRLLDFRYDGRNIRFMSELTQGDIRQLRIQTFDEAGNFLSEDNLPLFLANARLVWRRNVIVAQHQDTIYAFARQRPDYTPPAAPLIERAPFRITIDGDLHEWDDIRLVDLPHNDADVELQLAIDGELLCVAVNHLESSVQPKKERGLYSTGNWLEVRVGEHWMTVGKDAQGMTSVERSGGMHRGSKAAANYEITTRSMVYEAAIPMNMNQPRIDFHLRAWRTGSDGRPSIVFEWGFDSIR